MNTVLHADIFFIISSFGFIIFFILITMILFAILRLTKKVERIADMVEKKIDVIGDEAEELFLGLQDSLVFRILFGSRRQRKVSTTRPSSRKKE